MDGRRGRPGAARRLGPCETCSRPVADLDLGRARDHRDHVVERQRRLLIGRDVQFEDALLARHARPVNVGLRGHVVHLAEVRLVTTIDPRWSSVPPPSSALGYVITTER